MPHVAGTRRFSRVLLCCHDDGDGRPFAGASEEDEAVYSRSRFGGASGFSVGLQWGSRLDGNCPGEASREQADSVEENNRRMDGGTAGYP